MIHTTIEVAVGALAIVLAMNLMLTLRVYDAARDLQRDKPLTPPLGEPIPEIRGWLLAPRVRAMLPDRASASVLLFFSSACAKCTDRLPEVVGLLPCALSAGLAITLVSTEPARRLRRFLSGTPLAPLTLRVSRRDLKVLNPALNYPSYLFLDALGRVEAGGVIGDDNWQTFRTQLQDFVAPVEAAA